MERAVTKRHGMILALMMLFTMVMSMHAFAGVNTTLTLNADWTNGEIATGGDIDYYTFTVPSDGWVTFSLQGLSLKSGKYELYNTELTSSYDLYGYYSNASTVSPQTVSGTYALRAGTYVWKIWDGDNWSNYLGTYRVKATFKAAGNTEKRPNSSFDQAMALAEKQKVIGFQAKTAKNGFFKFRISKQQRVIITLTKLHQHMHFTLYDGDYQIVYEKDLYGGSETAPEIFTFDTNDTDNKYLQAGTYYIKISPANWYSDDSYGRYYLKWETGPCAHEYISKAVAPTYTAKGYTLHTCSKCGNKYKDAYIAKKTLAKPVISKYTRGKKNVKLTWKKISGASGYYVRYSTKSSMKSAKTVKVGSSTLTKNIKKLTSKKTYYFQVRAYRKTSSGNVYSKWSSKKKIKTK